MTHDPLAMRALAMLAVSRGFGYTAPVTSKKGVMGCESPQARGAKPHPARYAAFHFLASGFGGPNGEAQASPVTLRVPRSLTPVRAAAQCESWSAVVTKAQLEPIMASTTTLSAAAPVLSVINGTPTTTSNEVAQHFGKLHKDVLEKIAALIREVGPEFTERNFPPSEYTDSTGRVLPAYRLTRDGFTLVAMGFTGKKALAFKLAYIDAFNRMERELLAQLTRPQNPAIAPERISPAQAQHLRELVQLVVESGKQGPGETWNRLHRKMRVNSYLSLRPDQFDAACQYLRGKFDDTSIAALMHKHMPEALQALPAPAAPQALDVATLCQLILGGIFTGQDFLRLAFAVNQHQFTVADSNPHQGYGSEVASKMADLSWSDLRTINQRASLEVWLRTAKTQREIAA